MKRKTNVGNEEEPERCVGEDGAEKKQRSISYRCSGILRHKEDEKLSREETPVPLSEKKNMKNFFLINYLFIIK